MVAHEFNLIPYIIAIDILATLVGTTENSVLVVVVPRTVDNPLIGLATLAPTDLKTSVLVDADDVAIGVCQVVRFSEVVEGYVGEVATHVPQVNRLESHRLVPTVAIAGVWVSEPVGVATEEWSVARHDGILNPWVRIVVYVALAIRVVAIHQGAATRLKVLAILASIGEQRGWLSGVDCGFDIEVHHCVTSVFDDDLYCHVTCSVELTRFEGGDLLHGRVVEIQYTHLPADVVVAVVFVDKATGIGHQTLQHVLGVIHEVGVQSHYLLVTRTKVAQGDGLLNGLDVAVLCHRLGDGKVVERHAVKLCVAGLVVEPDAAQVASAEPEADVHNIARPWSKVE